MQYPPPVDEDQIHPQSGGSTVSILEGIDVCQSAMSIGCKLCRMRHGCSFVQRFQEEIRLPGNVFSRRRYK